MRILFIGNSFTFFNDLPARVSADLGCEVGRSLRGGAYLHDHLNEADELFALTREALKTPWDYVVLQEQSRNAFTNPDDYQQSVSALCALIRENGATPVIYETWAYRRGSDMLAATGLDYDAMQEALTRAARDAAEKNGALLAQVGQAFHASAENLLLPDDFHPNEQGTALACQVICNVIRNDC